MAGTTTNYAFNYPTSTDLVKDGATAFQTLATNIDTAMNSALSVKPAMGVLLNTTTVTAASSAAINNVFTSSYDSYLIIMTAKSSGGTSDLTFKLSAGGTATTTSGYAYCTTNLAFTATPSWLLGGSAGDTSGKVGTISTLECSTTIFLHQPAAAKVKSWWHQGVRTDGFSTGGNGYANYTTAYDGIQLTFTTCTGQIRIYGLRNS
jgi:hypothetical protein